MDSENNPLPSLSGNLSPSFADVLSQADRYVASKSRTHSLATLLDIFGTQDQNEITSKLEETGFVRRPSVQSGENIVKAPNRYWKTLQKCGYEKSARSNLKCSRYVIPNSETEDEAVRETSDNVISNELETNTKSEDSGEQSDNETSESDRVGTNADHVSPNCKAELETDLSLSESELKLFPSTDGNAYADSNSKSDSNDVTTLEELTNDEQNTNTMTDSIGHSSRDSGFGYQYKYGGKNYDVSLPPIGLLMEDGKIMPERIDPDIKHKVSEGVARLSRKIRVEDRIKMEEWIGLEIQLERQMWKSKLHDAMNEIEKHRKTSVTTTAKLQELGENILNVYPLSLPSSIYDEDISEYDRLQLMVSAVSSDLDDFIADKQNCLKLLDLVDESFETRISEKLQEMKQSYEKILADYCLTETNLREMIDSLTREINSLKYDNQKLTGDYQDLSLSLEKQRAVTRDRTDSLSSGESHIFSQKRTKHVEATSSVPVSKRTLQSNSLVIEPLHQKPPHPDASTVTFRLPTLENDNTARRCLATNSNRTKLKTLRAVHSSPSFGSNIKQCLRCKKPYRMQDNHKMACRYHAKSQVKAEKLKVDGTLESTCLIWECCAGEADAAPCCSGEHI